MPAPARPPLDRTYDPVPELLDIDWVKRNCPPRAGVSKVGDQGAQGRIRAYITVGSEQMRTGVALDGIGAN